MKCIDEGCLRAWLDRELDPEQDAAVANHVESCSLCREQAEALSRRSTGIAGLIGAEAAEAGAPDTEAALQRWRMRRREAAAAAVASRWFERWHWRPALAAAAALAVVIVVASTATGRAWAEHVLAMLRIEKVTTVPVDFSSLSTPEGHGAGEMLARLVHSDLVVTMKPQKPQSVADPATAARVAGFALRLPAVHPAPAQLTVGGEAAFQFTLHRQSLQAILNEAGRSDLQLPADIDNALVAVHIPHPVMARYGSCPAPQERGDKTRPQAPRRPHVYSGCVLLIEVPSPTVSVPPDLNLSQLAAIGLQMAGMSQAEAENYTRAIDWTSTLVIPVPEQIANSAPITVDGQQGVLIRRSGGEGAAPRYRLVWTRAGIVYSIGGWGDPAQGIQMANSLE